jgi:hypothetical protein
MRQQQKKKDFPLVLRSHRAHRGYFLQLKRSLDPKILLALFGLWLFSSRS